MSGASIRAGLVTLAATIAAVAAVAAAPSRAEAQRVQPSALREVAMLAPSPRRDIAAVAMLQQQRDTTPARRQPVLDRLSTEQKIGLAGIAVAGMTLVVANNARARQPVRSGFAIDQRSLVAVGAILGATVTAIWIDRRTREEPDAP
jgi:hypothetical protein